MLRRPPAADPVPVVLAAAGAGPVLVVTPAVDDARLLGGQAAAGRPDGGRGAPGLGRGGRGSRRRDRGPPRRGRRCRDLGAVVVLDEHDEALQEERAPTWHARDVALERARRAGVPCLLVSPVPSLAALQALGATAPRGAEPQRGAGRLADPGDRRPDAARSRGSSRCCPAGCCATLRGPGPASWCAC